MTSHIGIAVLVFIATNIDDILLLAGFFSNPKYRTRDIVLGQLIGIALLTGAAVGAARAAVAIPEAWIALLGFIPLLMGLAGIWNLIKGKNDDDDEEEKIAAQFRSQLLSITAVTVANGGDNLGVYIPLFANSPDTISIYCIVFALMTGLLCACGYYLVNNPWLGHHIKRYGRIALPLVLTYLGIHILYQARSLILG